MHGAKPQLALSAVHAIMAIHRMKSAETLNCSPRAHTIAVQRVGQHRTVPIDEDELQVVCCGSRHPARYLCFACQLSLQENMSLSKLCT